MTDAVWYFIVPACGWYGDTSIVVSSHRALEAARRAVRPLRGRCVIRRGTKRAGDVWLRSYESIYPEVK